jgi:hypothetical protein
LRIHSLLFVIPSEAGISYITALNSAAYVVLSKENHKQSTEAATLNRKSGGAEGSAVSLSSTAKAEKRTADPSPSLGMTKRREYLQIRHDPDVA